MRILGGMVDISYISESWSDSPTFSNPKSRQNFLPSPDTTSATMRSVKMPRPASAMKSSTMASTNAVTILALLWAGATMTEAKKIWYIPGESYLRITFSGSSAVSSSTPCRIKS